MPKKIALKQTSIKSFCLKRNQKTRQSTCNSHKRVKMTDHHEDTTGKEFDISHGIPETEKDSDNSDKSEHNNFTINESSNEYFESQTSNSLLEEKFEDENEGGTEVDQNYTKNDLRDLNHDGVLNNLPPLSSFINLKEHTILFSCNVFENTGAFMPYPDNFVDSWNDDYVKMPCSQQNIYKSGSKLEKRWDIIQNVLRNIHSLEELCSAIIAYNNRYVTKWNFKILKDYISRFENERQLFNPDGLISKMAKLALNLPTICTRKIPLLKMNTCHHITLSQKQISSLLANAFFCTFPRRNASGSNKEYATYPSINFSSLYNDQPNKRSNGGDRKIEKLKCIFNYFKRVTNEDIGGAITISRFYKNNAQLPIWENNEKTLTFPIFVTDAKIEDSLYSEIDFANKYIGGGVLSHGLVQEEIKFLQCPELIITRLFTEMLSENECLIVIGAETFNKTNGYANSFSFEKNFIDTTLRDSWKRKIKEIIAIDALIFHTHYAQFRPSKIVRELNKAYIGFYDYYHHKKKSSIATGNWGCGAFNGNTQLKFIIQLMAATEANRYLYYSTFGDKTFKKELVKMVKIFNEKKLTISFLWKCLLQYNKVMEDEGLEESLFSYITDILKNQFSIE